MSEEWQARVTLAQRSASRRRHFLFSIFIYFCSPLIKSYSPFSLLLFSQELPSSSPCVALPYARSSRCHCHCQIERREDYTPLVIVVVFVFFDRFKKKKGEKGESSSCPPVLVAVCVLSNLNMFQSSKVTPTRQL